MSFFEFPHTRTYDSDLGWLIKAYEELEKEYNQLISWENEHKAEYKELLRRVTSLENNISNFESEIERRFNELSIQLSEDIYRQLQLALAEINSQLGTVYQRLSNVESALIRQRLDLEGRIGSY